jgi:hypothetical protein
LKVIEGHLVILVIEGHWSFGHWSFGHWSFGHWGHWSLGYLSQKHPARSDFPLKGKTNKALIFSH